MRAAHHVRRAAGVYGVYCSKYSYAPDSFNLHFFNHIMEGNPFAVIETDGHAGDAGTKTRIEASLYCVAEDFMTKARAQSVGEFSKLRIPPLGLVDVHPDECILIPALGPGSEVAAAATRGLGYRAETSPAPDAGTLGPGRRHTSGKEHVPMSLTLGTLLRKLEAEKRTSNRFVFMMPGGRGSCSFGVYNLTNQLILHNLDLKARVHMYSPQDSGYFRNTPWISRPGLQRICGCRSVVDGPVGGFSKGNRIRIR